MKEMQRENRKRKSKPQADFKESLTLFTEIVQIVNKSAIYDQLAAAAVQSRTVRCRPNLSPSLPAALCPSISGDIQLRRQRDWEGLISERKEDIFGEYSVCFVYVISSEGGGEAHPVLPPLC